MYSGCWITSPLFEDCSQTCSTLVVGCVDLYTTCIEVPISVLVAVDMGIYLRTVNKQVKCFNFLLKEAGSC